MLEHLDKKQQYKADSVMNKIWNENEIGIKFSFFVKNIFLSFYNSSIFSHENIFF